MTYTKFIFILFFSYLFLTAQVVLCEEISVERFLSDAPESWKQLEDEYRKGYSSTSVCRYGLPGNRVGDVIGPKQAAISYKNMLLDKSEIDIATRVANEYLKCINNEYGFSLEKDREKDIWQISSISRQSKGMLFGNIGILQGNMRAFEGIMVEGAWLDAVINSNDFLVIKVENVSNDLDKLNSLIKLSFTSSYNVDEHNSILSGTFWFDPNLFWILSKYEIRLQSDTLGTVSKTLQYHVIDGVPYPEKIIQDYSFEGDPPIRYVTEYTDTKNNVDSDVFYLSHYGFSEPADPAMRINIIRVVLMAAGVLLVLFGLYLRWFAKKK